MASLIIIINIIIIISHSCSLANIVQMYRATFAGNYVSLHAWVWWWKITEQRR